MDLFVLNPRFKLIKNAQNAYNHLIEDSKSNEYITINEVIFSFLKLFSVPISLPEVAALEAKRQGLASDDIIPILIPFFNDMYNKEIIIRFIENGASKIGTSRRYASPSIFKDYYIKKLLSDNHPLYVYSGIHKTTKRKVILKIVEQSHREKKKYQRILQKEMKILGKFEHPNIVSLLEEDEYYGVIEYFSGKSLPEVVIQPIAMSSRVAIVHQLVSALAHIHSKSIIHGDLHTDNILINSRHQIKIIDFDLAANTSSKVARFGGIREFLAPELINDDMLSFICTRPNKRSEVYQIGIVIYFILYGVYPIDKPTWKSHIVALRNNEIDFAEKNHFEQIIPIQYIDTLKACLDSEPNKRPSSALKIYKKLTQIVDKRHAKAESSI